jgi:hypothetical protein
MRLFWHYTKPKHCIGYLVSYISNEAEFSFTPPALCPPNKTGFVALFAKRDSKLFTFRRTFVASSVICEKVDYKSWMQIYPVIMFLKIKRASVCCCRLIKSTNFDYFNYFTAISIAFHRYQFLNSSRILHYHWINTISANTDIQTLNCLLGLCHYWLVNLLIMNIVRSSRNGRAEIICWNIPLCRNS